MTSPIRFYGVFALALAVLPARIALAAPQPHGPAPATSRPAEKEQRIPHNLAVAALRKIIKNAEFKEMPFDEFVEWLERTTKTTVIVRWKLLDQAGVVRAQPITLKLKNVPLRKIIELVLDQLKRDDPSVRLAARADDNTLTLSTVRDIYRELVTRTYDVQDLLLTLPRFTGGKSNPPPGGSLRIRNSNPSHTRDSENTPDENTRRLIEAILATIQPESWKVSGGQGTIQFYRGRLIIRNNLLVHEQLGGGSPPTLPKK